MPKDFNQSTSLESYLKLQWVYSNTSIIMIRTLYVSNINTDCVQLFDSLFHTPPQANCNSVCSPHSIVHLLRQLKLIGKSGELHWELRLSTTLQLIVGTNTLKHKLSVLDRLWSVCSWFTAIHGIKKHCVPLIFSLKPNEATQM